MSACGKSDHTDLMRIDLPFRRMQPDDPHRALRVLYGWRGFRIDPAVAVILVRRTAMGHAVLQQHTRDASRRQPITDLGSFQIDGEDLITTAGKDHDRCARVLSHRRIHCEGWTRDFGDFRPWPTADRLGNS